MANTVIFTWLVIVLVVVSGWIMNIIDIFKYDFDVGITLEIALRLIGIFVAPLGAVMGWFF